MKTVVIARHAKSDWSRNLPDFDRPLNDRGKQDAPIMGRVLAKNGFQPDLIISSPAARAKATAIAVGKELGYESETIRFEEGIYHQGDIFIHTLIQSLPDDVETVMIFGHNPTQEAVVERLLKMDGSITMPTCAMACLETFAQHWKQIQPGHFSLKWFLIPKSVKNSVK